MYIFDRWGKKLYETVSLEDGWDGSFNGSPSPAGVYIWIIQYQSEAYVPEQKSETLKGTIMLLR
jgi:gliding motility-associated-like protein